MNKSFVRWHSLIKKQIIKLKPNQYWWFDFIKSMHAVWERVGTWDAQVALSLSTINELKVYYYIYIIGHNTSSLVEKFTAITIFLGYAISYMTVINCL